MERERERERELERENHKSSTGGGWGETRGREMEEEGRVRQSCRNSSEHFKKKNQITFADLISPRQLVDVDVLS
jgi:hypothetical protein